MKAAIAVFLKLQHLLFAKVLYLHGGSPRTRRFSFPMFVIRLEQRKKCVPMAVGVKITAKCGCVGEAHSSRRERSYELGPCWRKDEEIQSSKINTCLRARRSRF